MRLAIAVTATVVLTTALTLTHAVAPRAEGHTGSGPGAGVALAAPAPGAASTGQPNIVLVLMDDFSMDLLPTMRSAALMARRGASYPHSFVVDSLCCPSRTSLFTGQYPHQTGVRLNERSTVDPAHPLGGYAAYRTYGNGPRTFAVPLREAGYHTGFVGKFLNGFGPVAGDPPPLPLGWDEFDALFRDAYNGWGFDGSHVEDGRLVLRHYPKPAASADAATKDRMYAGSVTSRIALDFIARHHDDAIPWFLEVATYAPHSRLLDQPPAYAGDPDFPPAFRDRPSLQHPRGNCGRLDCADLGTADLLGYGDDLRDNHPYFRDGTRAPLSWEPVSLGRRHAEAHLRERARMTQSVDRMVLAILDRVPENTYVVLTSDNGFHLGQHGLGMGKGSAYDSDIRVPLLVTGPGVQPGVRTTVTSTIDLAATFEDLAGLSSPAYRSGRSLVPTFTDPTHALLRYAFVEHLWTGTGSDPDAGEGSLRMVPSYVAVRSATAVLIRTDRLKDPAKTQFVWEYYDLRRHGFEHTDTYVRPARPEVLARLQDRLRGFLQCRGVIRDEALPTGCLLLRQ